jgi:glutamine synthetase
MPISGENKTFEKWLTDSKVQEVEVLVSDFAGTCRGKKMPMGKFVKSLGTDDLRLPESIFGMTVACDFIGNKYITDLEEDVFLDPDFATRGLLSWTERPTAFFICDVRKADGTAFNMSPRQVLKNVLALYAEKGWQPVVAPEFEFTILSNAADPDSPPVPPSPPRGKSGRLTDDKGVMSLSGIDEFGQMFSQVRNSCQAMGFEVEALVQEAGVGQFEFNIAHGDPLQIADRSVHFKRAMKQAAVENGLHASFMAKPYADDFGNAMHLHQSVVDRKTGLNVFADEDGNDTELFTAHVAGLQKYASAAMPFFAPYMNSYLRLGSSLSSPGNTHWGIENRSVGLRVPSGGRPARRIENRIAGSDTNPYLTIAASLLCGYLGMIEGAKPSQPIVGSAYDLTTNGLPQHIYASLDALEGCNIFRDLLSDEFVSTFLDVKRAEIKDRSNELTSWDVKYLLANV